MLVAPQCWLEWSGFLETAWAYETKFTTGGKLYVRCGLDKARPNIVAISRLHPHLHLLCQDEQ